MKINLKEKLSHTEGIHSWQYNIKREKSHQIYLSKEHIESLRNTESEQIEVVIYRKLNDGRLGEATFYFTPVEEFQLDEKIEKAIYIAGLTAQKPFNISGPAEYKETSIFNQKLAENPREILKEFSQRIIEAVHREKDIKLSSSECYISEKDVIFCNSRGCEGAYKKSNISWDFVLLTGKELESESFYESSCCNYSQLNIEEKIKEYSSYGRDNVKTTLPKTCRTAIIVNAKALLPLFDPILSHSSGKFIYDKISCFQKGKEIYRGENITGDELNLSSNPEIPYGVKSAPFDTNGVAARRTEIIKNSRLENIWATKRYASYLDIAPTGAFSNIEVNPGSYEFDRLFETEKKPVYYIIKFSFLLPDTVSGDFATEIRFGYEIRPSGEKIPIKGGSVTGNVFEMLSEAKFSNKTIMEGPYFGPDAMRFENVSISGA